MMYDDKLRKAAARYNMVSFSDEMNISRELLQYCVLTALSKSGLFEKAAFLGGTSLRLFRGLDRYSEDLDFSLLETDTGFSFEPYLKKAEVFLKESGLNVEVKDKSKPDTNVKKAFIKDNTVPQILEFSWATRKTDTPQKLNVKIEVDANPPAGASFDKKIIPFPEHESITLYDMPSAFAGKCHALLTRKYIKGRDWYDFLFYVAQKTEPNYRLLTNALIQTGDYSAKEPCIDSKTFFALMENKIDSIDFDIVRKDILGFVPAERKAFLDSFSKKLFHSAVNKMKEYTAESFVVKHNLEVNKTGKDDGYGYGR